MAIVDLAEESKLEIASIKSPDLVFLLREMLWDQAEFYTHK